MIQTADPASLSSPSSRSTSRHLDQRRALLDAGVAVAREGGPGAVALRPVTRRAGVVPNAAYRHFNGHAALFEAVRAEALALLAETMQREMALVHEADPAARARGLFFAVGRSYMAFAQTETGLFRTAFAFGTYDVDRIDVMPTSAHVGLDPLFTSGAAIVTTTMWPQLQPPDPFGLLQFAMDALRDAGVLTPAQRVGAEFLAWSSMQGMAMQLIEGPLRHLGNEQRAVITDRLMAMVIGGLRAPG